VLILAPAAYGTETFAVFLAHRRNRKGKDNRLSHADAHVKLRTSVVYPFNIIGSQNNVLFIMVGVFAIYVNEMYL